MARIYRCDRCGKKLDDWPKKSPMYCSRCAGVRNREHQAKQDKVDEAYTAAHTDGLSEFRSRM